MPRQDRKNNIKSHSLIFMLFSRAASFSQLRSSQHILSSQQIIPPQMRRTTKYPPTVWTPTEFSPTNEEKVYCYLDNVKLKKHC